MLLRIGCRYNIIDRTTLFGIHGTVVETLDAKELPFLSFSVSFPFSFPFLTFALSPSIIRVVVFVFAFSRLSLLCASSLSSFSGRYLSFSLTVAPSSFAAGLCLSFAFARTGVVTTFRFSIRCWCWSPLVHCSCWTRCRCQ